MSLMAFFALGGDHVCTMWLVALGAERDFAMHIMAETTGEVGVFALNLLQLDNLLGMAGQTLVSYVVCQLDDFRSMRIIMTAHTIAEIVVRFAGMALAALGNIVFNHGTMP
jgi:hypothetical protein